MCATLGNALLAQHGNEPTDHRQNHASMQIDIGRVNEQGVLTDEKRRDCDLRIRAP